MEAYICTVGLEGDDPLLPSGVALIPQKDNPCLLFEPPPAVRDIVLEGSPLDIICFVLRRPALLSRVCRRGMGLDLLGSGPCLCVCGCCRMLTLGCKQFPSSQILMLSN